MFTWFKNLFRKKITCIDCGQAYPNDVMSEIWFKHSEGMSALHLCKACADELPEEIDADDKPLEFDGDEFLVDRYDR